MVATNWSGNTDFCRPDLCFLVDFSLVPVSDPHLSYAGTAGSLWADPDVAHAAAQLRRLRNDPASAFDAARLLRDDQREHLRTSTYEKAFGVLVGAHCSKQRVKMPGAAVEADR